ncbi:MAG: flippase [Eubacteriaceae bacterium]
MGNELREVGKKSSIFFAGNIFGKFIISITGIIIVRYLGAEIYGQYIYVVSFLMFFTIIPKLGMENGIVSFLSRKTFDNEIKKSIVSSSLIITFLLSTFVVVISYINKNFIYEKLLNEIRYSELFLVLLPSVILDSIKAILLNSLRAVRKIKEITFIENIINPISKIILILALIILFNIKNYYSIVIPLYLNSITAIIYCLVKLKKYNLIGKVVKRFDIKQFIKFSFPLLFASVVAVITENVDIYMIGYIMDAEKVGIYKVAIQFGTLSNFALLSVDTIFAPIISNLYYDNRLKDLSNMYKFTTKWISIINLMVFGMILVFSKDIMHVAGEEFVVGGIALIIICFGQVINSMVGSVGFINIMTGHPKLEMFSGITAMIFNLILNSILIKKYGINGAAVATAVALFTKNVMNFAFMYKNLKMNPYDKSYLKVFGILIITTIFIYFTSSCIHTNYFIRLLICGFLYTIIFISLIYKFAMSEYEINTFKRQISKRIKKKL